MDCDDATLLVAAAEARTLNVSEATKLHQHAEGCTECRDLLVAQRAANAAQSQWHSIVSVPEDALDDQDLLVLPVVDPSVFISEGELARGGMGRILRARDRRLGRDVAIKEVIGANARARFEREVQITAQLQHPAIIPVYEAGAWPDGAAFYAMRLVSGGTLGDAIDKTKTIEERLALLPHVVALTDALAYAHSKRIVHRDLKPGNVLVGEFGETVVIDWGLAKDLDKAIDDGASDPHQPVARNSDLTIAGSVMGTPGYMSPEQADGEEVDARTDVYALGAILYTLLCGHAPYLDDPTIKTAQALMAAAHERPPTSLVKLAPEAPPDLHAIAERAMARDKALRFPSAKEMTDELRRFQAGKLLQSREYRTRELIARWVRRHRTAVSVAAIAALVLAVVAIVSVRAVVARKNEAEVALARGRLEQGRQLLVAGDPAKAAPYLAAAVARLPDDAVAHRLADIALRDADRAIATIAGTAAAFSPDGKTLAVGHTDGSVALVDAATGAEQRVLPAAGGKVTRVVWLADRILTTTAGAAHVRPLDGPPIALATDGVDYAELVPGGIALATATGVRIVSLDGKPLASAPLEKAGFIDVDGDRLLAIGDKDIAVWRLPDLAPIATLPGTWWARLDRDGSVVTGNDQILQRYALPDTTPVVLQRGDVQSIVRLPDGQLVTANMHIDAAGTHPLVPDGATNTSAAIDATHVVTGGFDQAIRIWDLERTAQPIAVLAARDGTALFAVDPTHARVAAIGWHDTIGLWDVTRLRGPTIAATTGGSIGDIEGHERLAAMVFGDRDRVAIVTRTGIVERKGWLVGASDELALVDDNGSAHAYDVETGDERFSTPGPGVWPIGLSSSGAREAEVGNGKITIRDAKTWSVVASFPAKLGSLSALAVDDDGHVVTGGEDGAIEVWDAKTGTGTPLPNRGTHVVTLAIRGEVLYSSSWDETLRAWDLHSGRARGVVLSRVRDAVAVSPDGKSLATTERGGLVDIWDDTGRLLEKIPTKGTPLSVTFASNIRLAVGGSAGVIEVYDLSAPERSDAWLRSHEDRLDDAER